MNIDTENLLIYLIEDNKADSLIGCSVIKKTLPSATVQPFFQAHSALESLQAISNGQESKIPALILLDIVMPSMDGFDFLEQYQQFSLATAPQRPLLYVLTTSLSASDLAKARSHPLVEDVLFKTFSQKAFTSILNKHFRHLSYTNSEVLLPAPAKDLTIENWVSEYKRLERVYEKLKDKQSVEARGLLDQMEAVWLIILEMNSKNKSL